MTSSVNRLGLELASIRSNFLLDVVVLCRIRGGPFELLPVDQSVQVMAALQFRDWDIALNTRGRILRNLTISHIEMLLCSLLFIVPWMKVFSSSWSTQVSTSSSTSTLGF